MTGIAAEAAELAGIEDPGIAERVAASVRPEVVRLLADRMHEAAMDAEDAH